MRIAYDPAGVAGAAARVAVGAQDARRVADAAAAVATGAAGGALAGALHMLADVCGDVLEVVALDLDLLAGRVRAGATLYDTVERDAAASVTGGVLAP